MDVTIGRFVVVGLLVLAAALFCVIVNATLTGKGAASKEESRAVERIDYLHPFITYTGALAGVLVCAWSLIAAGAQFGRSTRGWSALLLVAAAAALVACHTLLLEMVRGAGADDFPMAEHWRSQLAVAALAVACAIWALRCWHIQGQRIHSNLWASAETRIENCLKRATWRDLLHCLVKLFLSAGLMGLLVGAPVAWIAIARTNEPPSGFIGVITLSAAGVVLFSLLQCVVLGAILAGLVIFVRLGYASQRAALAIGMIAALFATIFLFGGLSLSFYQEFRELRMLFVAGVALLTVGLFFGVAVSHNLLDLCRERDRPRGLGDLVRIVILSGVLIGVLPLIRRITGRVRPTRSVVATGAIVLSAMILILLPWLFPGVRDFLDRIEFFLVSIIVLLIVLLGHVIAPVTNGNRKVRLAALGVLVATSGLLVAYSYSNSAMSHVRPQVFQHNPLGKCSLHIVERVIGSSTSNPDPVSALPDKTPRFKASPTKREAIMDELRTRRPLIIFIIWDAARPDRMSFYGYRRTKPPLLPTTPMLDANRGAFVQFTNAFSQATATSCSMRHFFTGRYSSRWMLRDKGVGAFWTNELMRAGYDTFFLNIIGSDYNGISLDAFSRDMPDDLKSRLELLDCDGCAKHERNANAPRRLASTRESDAEQNGKINFVECNRQDERQTVRDLLAMLETKKDSGGAGSFAYIHMDATHTPWRKHAGIVDYGDEKQDLYDNSMRYEDTVTGELIAGLKKLGMWRQTVFILTADHGTGLGDHTTYGGYHPYLEQIRIPLLIKIPGVTGRRVDALVGLFDVGPTLVDAFRSQHANDYEGRSLWPVILEGEKWNDRLLFGLDSFADNYYLVHADGLHYIRHREFDYEQLFNWKTDPLEKTNLINVDRPATIRARTLMDWFLNVYGRGRTFNDPHHYSGSSKPPRS